VLAREVTAALAEAIEAYAGGDYSGTVALLQPLEQDERLDVLPKQLADIRALLANAYEKQGEDLLAIVIYGRLLTMSTLSDGLRKLAREKLHALATKWHVEGLKRVSEQPAEAVVILKLIEGNTRDVLDRALLAKIRLALGAAYKAQKSDLSAADMFLRYARMIEASVNARLIALTEVESVLVVKTARDLVSRSDDPSTPALLDDLAVRLHDLPVLRAAAHAAHGWWHYERGRHREANRELIRALRALPAGAEADRVYLRNRLDEIRQNHFGELQILCPVGIRSAIRATIYGPTNREREGIEAETVDVPCGSKPTRLIQGVYMAVAYGLSGSGYPSIRYELALDAGERKRIPLKMPESTGSLHGMLFGAAALGAAGAIGVQLYAAQSSGSDDTAAAMTTGVLSGVSVTALIWAIVELSRSRRALPSAQVAGATGRPPPLRKASTSMVDVGPASLILRF